MKDHTDMELLRLFYEGHSEPAFAELVARYVDLVHSAALRQVHGASHIAPDVTQAVFCELARNAKKVAASHRTLGGWLYTTTRFAASRLVRSESRRVVREHAFAMHNANHDQPEVAWKNIENLLDDAMQDLSAEDREAVVLRYFRNEPFRVIGEALGATENAARMRVDRALEKLRSALGRRGITCPSAIFGALLSANVVSTAPVGLAATITPPAIAAAGALTSTSILNAFQFMAATKLKAAVAFVAIAGTTTGWLVSHNQRTKLEHELGQLRAELAQSSSLTSPQNAQFNADNLSRWRADRNELMRLRSEVSELRRKEREANRLAAATPAANEAPQTTPAPEQPEPDLQTQSIARMNAAKGWAEAFFFFAEANGGRIPMDLSEAAVGLPEESVQLTNTIDTFEILFQGRLDQIENPSQAIILREREPFHIAPDGSALRTYLFADGHSEIHKAREGNFEPWEIRMLPKVKAVASSEPSSP